MVDIVFLEPTKFASPKTKKAISRECCSPLMASEPNRIASDGAGYDDPKENNDGNDGNERPGWKTVIHWFRFSVAQSFGNAR
jgi:hypothetical protein